MTALACVEINVGGNRIPGVQVTHKLQTPGVQVLWPPPIALRLQMGLFAVHERWTINIKNTCFLQVSSSLQLSSRRGRCWEADVKATPWAARG